MDNGVNKEIPRRGGEGLLRVCGGDCDDLDPLDLLLEREKGKRNRLRAEGFSRRIPDIHIIGGKRYVGSAPETHGG